MYYTPVKHRTEDPLLLKKYTLLNCTSNTKLFQLYFLFQSMPRLQQTETASRHNTTQQLLCSAYSVAVIETWIREWLSMATC